MTSDGIPEPAWSKRNGAIPKLLVSVRNSIEAQAAIVGGCDLVDIKEPEAGPLGCASPTVINEVVLHAQLRKVPVSAALGEWHEWAAHSSTDCPEATSLRVRRPDYAKLGLSRLATEADPVGCWRKNVRYIEASYFGGEPQWVAVIYADAERAQSPQAESILEALDELQAEIRFAGLLVDTYSKDAGRLLDFCSVTKLMWLREQTQERGLFLALAGRIDLAMLPSLRPVAPDVIAIRSAACVSQSRTSAISTDAVAQFRANLQQCFSSHSGSTHAGPVATR